MLVLRMLRRSPGFAATAVVTLALGIGLATAVFTVADTLLLRRLPVRDQNRLVVLWGEARGRDFRYPLRLADARDFARGARSLERAAFVIYYGASPTPVRDGDRITRLRRGFVSGEFFRVLGTQPLLGRALRPTDDVSGAAPVAVLSYGAWQERFGGDAHVLGRRVVTYGDSVAYTIVGVMPRGLDYPRGTDFWAPVAPASVPKDVYLLGRLAAGRSGSDARAELTAYFGRPQASAWQRDLRGTAQTLPRLILGDVRPAVIAFAAAAGLLLLITCLNVANLLLVRGLARVREVAVRSALGAGRARIIRGLLAESALLAAAGGALGIAVAAGAVRLFVRFAPAGLPRLDEIGVNAPVLAGAIAITAIATLLFALAPAVATSRVDLEQALRSTARHSAGRGSRLAAEALVAGQVAIALIVLSAAGLIARSLVNLERARLSFEPRHLLIGELALRGDLYGDAPRQRALLGLLLPQLRAVPGVRAVSPVVAIPFSGSGGWDGKLASAGQSPAQTAANPMLNLEVVSPEYFAALGIPLRRGRLLTEADREGAPPAVVVSASVARYYWGAGDPIGEGLRMDGDSSHTLTVVGVVPDTRYRDLRDARPSVYFPLRQSPFPYMPTTLAIRTSGPPAALAPTLRSVIAETAPGVTLAAAAPFATFLQGPLAQPRLNALLLGVFAATAVALAAVGLCGVMMTLVRRRTRELGVRLALGASAADLRRMVLRRGLTLAALGSTGGLLGAVAAGRLLRALLYQVSPADPITLGAVVGLLLLMATLATFLPARATTRIDPVVALRAEG